MYDKILGGLLGGAVGDAMGAATEARTTEQIIQIFGHEVTDFEKPPADTIDAGSERGVKSEYRRVILEKNQLDILGLAQDMLTLIEK